MADILLNVPVSSVPFLKNPQSHPYPIATLTDLGLSCRIPAPPESPLLTTRCGSEDYAAPEILLGQPYDGRQTDVRLTPRGRRAAQNVGTGASSAFGSLLDKVPRGERARVIEALEAVAKIVDATQR